MKVLFLDKAFNMDGMSSTVTATYCPNCGYEIERADAFTDTECRYCRGTYTNTTESHHAEDEQNKQIEKKEDKKRQRKQWKNKGFWE